MSINIKKLLNRDCTPLPILNNLLANAFYQSTEQGQLNNTA